MSLPSNETLNTIGKYGIAGGIIAGCFIILSGLPPDSAGAVQPWSVITLVVGWIVRDSAGQQATTNAVKTIAAANGATT